MHRIQTRRERPTLKTAHSFHKEGSFGTDPELHTLSGAAREAELKKVENELIAIVPMQFPRTRNLEFAILKSHLIIEFALAQYIRCFARVFVDTKELKFTFSQKIEIAYLMGFGSNDPILLPTIEALNIIRNQVAHTFALNRDAVDEILRVNHEEYDDFKPTDDRQRVRFLRQICIYICSRIAGEIGAAYFIAKNTELVLSEGN